MKYLYGVSVFAHKQKNLSGQGVAFHVGLD